MKLKLALPYLIIGALLAPIVAISADATDSDRSHPKAFVKDSAITTKIKTRLAAKHLGSLARIHVDTDSDGVVYLSGTARSQKEIDKAVSIARHTERVTAVRNELTIKKDD